MMTWQQLFDEIKNARAKGVYLFTGPEEFVKRSAIDKLREAILPQGLEALNEATLEGVDAQTIIESAETLPVMCDQRLVIIKDWAPLTGAKGKDVQGDAERLEAWLPKAPESCVTVFFVRGEADKRQKAYKALEKYAQVVPFPLLTDSELARWIQSRLRGAKKTIRMPAVNKLIFLAGRELTRLAGEIDKLSAYVEDRQEITEADVDIAVTPGVESNVFAMIDFLMAKKAREAYEILNAMMDAGESPVGILALITRQMRLLTHVKLLKNENLTLPEIERRSGLSGFVAKKAYQQCTRFSEEALQEGYRMSVDYDYSVKSGKIRDRAALDAMMLKLYMLS